MNYTIVSERVRGSLRASEVLQLAWGRALETMYLWWRRARTRRELEELDDRILADVGLDRVEARREAAKPFWQG